MRCWPVLVSLSAAVAISSAHHAAAAPPAEREASQRVRELRRQVEQNDAQIRVLEETVRKLQDRRVVAEPSKRVPAPTASPAPSSAPSLGEISAWTSTGPASAAATPPPPVEPQVRPQGTAPSPTPTRPAAGGRFAAATGSRPARKRNALAGAPLKVGMSQVAVWETLGPPEFVRGRRTEVQYWHYGPGWIRFQSGRLTRWEPGSKELQAARE